MKVAPKTIDQEEPVHTVVACNSIMEVDTNKLHTMEVINNRITCPNNTLITSNTR